MAADEVVSINRLACPFCGSKDDLGIFYDTEDEYDRPAWWVQCGYCDARGPRSFDDNRSVNKWNDRAPPTGEPKK